MIYYFLMVCIFFVLVWMGVRYILRHLSSQTGNNIIVLAITVAACFLCGETYYRFWYVKSDAFMFLSTNFSKKYYQKDKWGFRDSNLPLLNEKPNIIIVGDSFIFGGGLKTPEERYSNILRARLPEYHIINLAKSGATTADEAVMLLQHHRPEAQTAYIVLNYVFNDIEDAIPHDKKLKKIAISGLAKKAMKWSEFFKHIYFNLIYPRKRFGQQHSAILDDAHKDKSTVQKHIAYIKLIQYLTEQLYHARLMIVFWPWPYTTDASPEYRCMLQEYEKLGIPTIDLVSRLSGYDKDNLIVSSLDPHPSAFANKLVGDIVFEFLAKELRSSH